MQGIAQNTPVMLCFSSHDPTGSIGVQADIETAVSLGCHCACAITALTSQITAGGKHVVNTSAAQLIAQARSVLETMPVAAIKIGFAGNLAAIKAIRSILMDYPEIPVVLDIVAQVSTDAHADRREIYAAITNLLLPLVTLATPSFFEAHELAHEADSVDACAYAMLDGGCQFVLISDTLTGGQTFSNALYGEQRLLRRYEWPRISTTCAGSGATLAASITAYLAQGFTLADAVEQGQKFTWQSLKQARRLNPDWHIPNRFHWLGSTTPMRPSVGITH